MTCNHIGPCGASCGVYPYTLEWPWGPTLPPRPAHDWITTTTTNPQLDTPVAHPHCYCQPAPTVGTVPHARCCKCADTMRATPEVSLRANVG